MDAVEKINLKRKLKMKQDQKVILGKIAEPSLKLIILGVLTGGGYLLLHLYKNQDNYNDLSNDKNDKIIHSWMIYTTLGIYIISGIGVILGDAYITSAVEHLILIAQTIENGSGDSWFAQSLAHKAVFEIDAHEMINILMVKLNYLVGILLIIIAFKIRKLLQIYTKSELNKDLKMNGFLIFFLTIFYTNYKMNKIITGNIIDKQNINNSPNNDITEQLEKINDLKVKGILSQDEFDKKKKDLLDKL